MNYHDDKSHSLSSDSFVTLIEIATQGNAKLYAQDLATNNENIKLVFNHAFTSTNSVQDEAMQDLQDSIMLSHLAANKKIDMFSEWITWVDTYYQIFEKLGWTLSEFDSPQQDHSNSQKSIWDFFNSFSDYMPISKIVTKLHEISAGRRGSRTLEALEEHSHREKSFIFTVSYLDFVGGEYIHYEFRIKIDGKFPIRSVKEHAGSSIGDVVLTSRSTRILNLDVYGAHRTAVREKLEKYGPKDWPIVLTGH